MPKLPNNDVVYLAERTHIYDYGEENEIANEDVCAVFENYRDATKWLHQYAKSLRKQLSGHEVTLEKWRENSEYDIWYREFSGSKSCYTVCIVHVKRKDFVDIW